MDVLNEGPRNSLGWTRVLPASRREEAERQANARLDKGIARYPGRVLLETRRVTVTPGAEGVVAVTACVDVAD